MRCIKLFNLKDENRDHFYTEKSLQKEIDKKKTYLVSFGSDHQGEINLMNVTHFVQHLHTENGVCYGYLYPLYTPANKIYNEIRDYCTFNPVGYGKINENNEVEDYELSYISIEKI